MCLDPKVLEHLTEMRTGRLRREAALHRLLCQARPPQSRWWRLQRCLLLFRAGRRLVAWGLRLQASAQLGAAPLEARP